MRTNTYIVLTLLSAGLIGATLLWPWAGWWLLMLLLLLPAWLMVLSDALQTEHALRRNFPLLSRGRWLAEHLRPYTRQYFLESETDGAPIERMFRSLVYQRAKSDVDTNPFGTKLNVYLDGYEWLGHSLGATNVEQVSDNPRVTVGTRSCKQPYCASVFNISGMSFGALSHAAISALNKGAKQGGFYHNTGEGSISPYHLEGGGDLVWQIGTGYFGCRSKDGRFDDTRFREKARLDVVKMIEIKLSQGAKPGHGGILPAEKNTPEIASIRTVEPGTDVISPSTHPEFKTPLALVQFAQRLRMLCDGKPVGIKLCIGRRSEFLGICKAMVETGLLLDFVTVDGGEGGTGAAPLEYSNSVGMPLREALAFVDDALTGFGLRDEIRIIAAGKVFTGFHLAKNFALGADIINSARGMMMALGCVQSLSCHTNTCPTGVATQDPKLIHGLVVPDKAERVYRFHKSTIHALTDLISSTGLRSPGELTRSHIFRRVDQQRILRYDEIFPPVQPGALLRPDYAGPYAELLTTSRADRFI